MGFSFGFGGDDIEGDEVGGETEGGRQMDVDGGGGDETLLKPFELELDDLLANLPSSLSFRLHTIPSDYGPGEYTSHRYPRRDLHDIRAQIMSTSDPSAVDAVHEAALSSNGDLTSGIYEGGFKTWECSNDLAWWMLERGPEALRAGRVADNAGFDVVELGAGTALPSCVILDRIVRERMERRGNGLDNHDTGPRNAMLLADYNEAVLRLCTFPNVFLTWFCAREQFGPSHPHGSAQGEEPDSAQDTTTASNNARALEDGYLEITPELKHAFLADLRSLHINLRFLAGSWGPDFVTLVSASPDGPPRRCLLASETIYSPKTLDAFTATLAHLLDPARARAGSRAVVAAKRIYFGVGGGVDEFKRRLKAAHFDDEWDGGFGVGRWIGQIGRIG